MLRKAILPLLMVALLSGCGDRWPWSRKEAQKTEAPKPGKPASPPVRNKVESPPIPVEISVETLQGVWRVTGVATPPGAKFAKDDKRILGSLIDLFPEQMRWSYKASADIAGDESCLEPVSGVIAVKQAADGVRRDLGPALAQFGVDPARAGPPHEWLCGDGGSWGQEGKADFMPVDSAHMVMRWRDGAILMLERIRR